MICSNCGREIPDGSSRCYCGQTFTMDGQQPVMNTNPITPMGAGMPMAGVTPGANPGAAPGAATVTPGAAPGAAVVNPGAAPGAAVVNPGAASGVATVTPGAATVNPGTAPGAAVVNPQPVTPMSDPVNAGTQPVMSGSILSSSQRINAQGAFTANAAAHAPQQSYIPNEPVKKQKNTGLIVTLAIVATLLVGIIAFLAYYINRPIYKIEQAMEKENIEKVIALYPKLTKDEDQDYVQDQMYGYADSLKNQFVNGEAEYDEISGTLTDLGEDILADYPGYDSLVQSVDDLNKSRNAFAKAQSALQSEDYETALEQYELVIPEDSNYEAAQDGIETVKEFLVPDIIGAWSAEIDLGSYLTAQVGYGSSDLSFTMEIVYEFGEDGIATCYIDEDSIYANKEAFADYLMNMLYEYYEMTLGMSRDEIDSYFAAYYGMSMQEMMEEELSVDKLLQIMADEMQTEEFEYRVEADAFVIEKGSEEVRMYIEKPDNDTLVITGTDNPDLNDSALELLSEIGMDFPMTFIRK